MPRVIDARERIRAAGEHADDVLLAAQVAEGHPHHTAAAHHHFERLVTRPRLDHDARVHRTGSRAALLVVPGGQMHTVLRTCGTGVPYSYVCRVCTRKPVPWARLSAGLDEGLDTSGGSPRALRPFELRLRPTSLARSRISRLSERLPVQVRRAKGNSSGCATTTMSIRWCTPRLGLGLALALGLGLTLRVRALTLTPQTRARARTRTRTLTSGRAPQAE